jgi:hypothetical protein
MLQHLIPSNTTNSAMPQDLLDQDIRRALQEVTSLGI